MIKSVKGIIVNENNYLLQLRDDKRDIYFPNFWGIFGGQVEKNESNKKAIEREIREETNLIVKTSRMILSTCSKVINLKKKFNTIYYECKILKKKNIILTEGQKYKFFSFDQIKKINIFPMYFWAIKIHHLIINQKKNIFPKKDRIS